MAKYNVTIGMEIHVELKTQSKMFGVAPNLLGSEKEPNVSIDPVVTAEPGSLPVPNKEAIRFVQKAGIALGCEIAQKSKFDRKNYFYPDLPKGYQISQFDQPLCQDGYLDIEIPNAKSQKTMKIGITRIHMEEDTGKSTHPTGADHTLVDLNRAGVPLMELVSEPDLVSGSQARAFCQTLQQIFRYIEIADADIDKGQMRCEVNISLYKDGEDPLSGTKVEVKNIGSFRSVERAAEYEIKRQTAVLDDGGEIVQETRGWDDGQKKTISQRLKEDAHDYRYFPDPDIPPMIFSDEYIDEIKRTLPELPAAKRIRFREEFGISEENLDVIIVDKKTAHYFEKVVAELVCKNRAKEMETDVAKATKIAANYMVSELQKHLVHKHEKIEDIKITPENFAELVSLIADGKINSSAAQSVLIEMYDTGGDPSHIIDEKGLAQVSDTGALEKHVDDVLAANEQSVADYKAGKDKAIKYLMGQVMSASKGVANPQMVMQMLKEKLPK